MPAKVPDIATAIADTDSLDVDRIWEDALRILDEVGLQFRNDAVRQVQSAGISVKGDRVLLAPDMCEVRAAEIRELFGADDEAAQSAATELAIHNSPLHHYWFDPADATIKPFTVESVIRNTKLTCQLAEEGLIGGAVAGVPQDVAGELQFVTAQYLNCVYNPHAWFWGTIHTEPMMRYMVRMGDVMGFEPSVGSEVVSPLRFVGESIDLSLKYGRRGFGVSVDSMPIVGVTAPMDWHAAWAQSVAENIGSYALLRACGVENVRAPTFRLFLPNMACGCTYFSAPQHAAALLSRRQIRSRFGLKTEAAELLLVSAKIPDQQAAIEKTMGCMTGKLLGFPYLEGAGSLWMDEIFSPQQLIIDIDIKRAADAMTVDFGRPEHDIVRVMDEAIASKGFSASDLTLDGFSDFLWRSDLFDLAPRSAWTGAPAQVLKHAAAIAEEKIAAYDYEVTDERREHLDRIMAQAEAEIG